MYTIYMHTIAGKSYIGQTCQSLTRRSRHDFSGYDDSTYFGRAIQKHGVENIKTEVLYRCETLDEANRIETLCIARWGTLVPHGYNLETGGRNTRLHQDTKQKISDAKSGQPLSVNHRQNISKGLRNMPHDRRQETNRRIGNAHRGQRRSPETCRNISIGRRKQIAKKRGQLLLFE